MKLTDIPLSPSESPPLTDEEPPSLAVKNCVPTQTTPMEWLTKFWPKRGDMADKDTKDSIRETLAEYIDDTGTQTGEDPASHHERVLLSNILKLRDMTVHQVMVPRADIIGLSVKSTHKEVLQKFSHLQISRMPVYDTTLDDVLGTVHLKDILSALADGQDIALKTLVTNAPVISPSMPILDLLLRMRQSRRQMALVVDEYGGIDGLVTIGDIVEAIVGEIDDEHDTDDDPKMVDTASGSVLIDARVSLDDFCQTYGFMLSDDEMQESDTIAGLAFSIAGKVPVRGEILTHTSGMLLEIIDADPRRINRLRIRDIPASDHTLSLHSSKF